MPSPTPTAPVNETNASESSPPGDPWTILPGESEAVELAAAERALEEAKLAERKTDPPMTRNSTIRIAEGRVKRAREAMKPRRRVLSLNGRVRAARAFVARDGGRPVLASINIRGGYVEAADGFSAMRVELPAPSEVALEGSEDYLAPDANVLLPAGLGRAIKSGHRGGDRAFLRRFGNQVLAVDAIAGDVLGGWRPVDGTFPELARVFPETPPVMTVAINPEFLRNVGLAAKDCDLGTGVLRMEVRAPNEAVIFRGRTADDGEVTFAVMPMVLEGDGAPSLGRAAVAGAVEALRRILEGPGRSVKYAVPPKHKAAVQRFLAAWDALEKEAPDGE